MLEQVKVYLEEQDALRAVTHINASADPRAAMKFYVDFTQDLFYQRRDTPLALMFARAAMQFGLDRAAAVEDADFDLAKALRADVRAVAYDLASFTWPGWGAAVAATDPTATAIGHDAAKVSLRLAYELLMGDLQKARGHWMLGAHLLAAGDRAGAVKSFGESARRAQSAGAEDEALQSEAFAALARWLASPGEIERAELDSAERRLAAMPNGALLADQVETAAQIFWARRKAGGA